MLRLSTLFLPLLLALFLQSCSDTQKPLTLDSFSLNLEPVRLATNTSVELRVNAHYSDGSTSPLSSSQVAFSTGNASIATVDENGTLQGINDGNTTVTVATIEQFPDGSPLKSQRFNVIVQQGTPQSLRVTPALSSLAVGQTQSLQVVVSFSEGFSQDVTSSASYSSSSPDVATIDANALIRAIKEGNTSITVNFQTLSERIALDVTAAVVSDLQLSPQESSLNSGEQITLQAEATYSDASSVDVTTQALYFSSDEQVASVSTQGVVTALSQGDSTITATFEAARATATIAVDETPHLELSLKNENSVFVEQMFPYLCDSTAACTKSLILPPQGGIITLATFKLRAVGADFEIKSVQATSAQNIGSPEFFNLSSNTVIKAGSEREFQLRATQTLSAIVDLRFTFTTDLNLNSQFIETYKFQTTANPNN